MEILIIYWTATGTIELLHAIRFFHGKSYPECLVIGTVFFIFGFLIFPIDLIIGALRLLEE